MLKNTFDPFYIFFLNISINIYHLLFTLFKRETGSLLMDSRRIESVSFSQLLYKEVGMKIDFLSKNFDCGPREETNS